MCMCKHSQLYRSTSAAGWLRGQPAATRSTLPPTVADSHRQPYDLYSSMIHVKSVSHNKPDTTVICFYLFYMDHGVWNNKNAAHTRITTVVVSSVVRPALLHFMCASTKKTSPGPEPLSCSKKLRHNGKGIPHLHVYINTLPFLSFLLARDRSWPADVVNRRWSKGNNGGYFYKA